MSQQSANMSNSSKTKKRKSAKYYKDKHARTARRKAAAAAESAKAWIPQITEQDMLSFQKLHFGDDSEPANWFVDAETALNLQPGDLEDDGLGYYEDGVKRTLTDEDIEYFRRSELLKLELQAGPRKEDPMSTTNANKSTGPPALPSSPETKIEADLDVPETGDPQPEIKDASVPEKPSSKTQNCAEPPPVSRRNAKKKPSSWREQRSHQDVPYAQRHKRNWEQYIESTDKDEGSLTHRRILRELDEQVAEDIEMDY